MKTIISTTKGLVKGIREGSCLVFKNIPYAKPPVRNLRFRRPVEMDPWEGVLDCTAFGNITVQRMPGNEQPWEKLYYKEFYSDPSYLREMSEDCLNLNVWTPAKTPEDHLPVAFWIHGGGFQGGYSSEIEFGGEAFAEKGVVLVTIEYRCGALGFLAHPWLSQEDELGISGNYGIFDQIAALNWVYENIAAFGGDPENITVFGQSAGCMSTQVLISSELTKGKIARAILQSGVQVETRFLQTPTLQEGERYGEKLVNLAGVSSLGELRAIPARELLKANEAFNAQTRMAAMQDPQNQGDGMVIVPYVDGYLLKESVREVFQHAALHNIPYMAGCTMDDLGTTPEDRAQRTPGMLLRENRAFCHGMKEMLGRDAYCYIFSRELPGEDGKNDMAFHSSELWYTFGTLGRCWRSMEKHDYELSDQMVTAWTDFMKTGQPGMDWKPCTKEDSQVKAFC